MHATNTSGRIAPKGSAGRGSKRRRVNCRAAKNTPGRYVDNAAEDEDEDGDEEEEPEELETRHDRSFVNDDASSIASSRNGYRAPGSPAFSRQGRRVEYNGEEPPPKKSRAMPRVLQVLQPLGLYCDYSIMMPMAKLLPRISHLVSPYQWYHHCEDPRTVNNQWLTSNEFLPSLQWMQNDEVQIKFARLFASYGKSHDDAGLEPLRSVARMQPQGDADALHARAVYPVAEVISAHNVLDGRDEIDSQPSPDVCDEFVCKGDFLSERKMRGGCPMGGLPGLASVALFAFEEATAGVQVSELVLRIFKYWNLGASRPALLAGQQHAVETETTEFYKDAKTNTKSARVTVRQIPRDSALDNRAVLEHVHPTLLAKHDSQTVHACRTLPPLDSAEEQLRLVIGLFDCQLHVVPNTVRDCRGKTRVVVASVLVIRGTVPGCDPLLALKGMTSAMQGFTHELMQLSQHMVRLLDVSGNVSTEKLFETCANDSATLAAITHEANLPLAFFNFLRQKQMSSREPSPFAADWMGQRIDVYDVAEVALYRDYLAVAHHSRSVYYAQVALHTSHDLKNSRNAQLELPTTSVDWKLFFPGAFLSFFYFLLCVETDTSKATGQHYRAVPRAALREDLELASPTDAQRAAFVLFLDANPDPTHIFLLTDGAPHTRGYVCSTQPTMRAEDNPETVKLREQHIFKEGNTRLEELQCVHYSSRRFEMYATFAFATRDPYAFFLEPATPYASLEGLNERLGSLSTIEREYHALLAIATVAVSQTQRERMRTNLVYTVYGLADHPMLHALEALRGGSDADKLLLQTRELIAGAVSRHLHVCAGAPMPQLQQAARFALDLALLDEAPASARENIAPQHILVHSHACGGVPNDDAQAALREAQHFRAFQSELNVVNHTVLRWLLCSHVSLWSSTLSEVYGYCIQICDMGNSVRVCMKKSSNFDKDEMIEWDKKMPGSGADMIWNIFGEYVNGFPKFAGPTAATQQFAATNNFCQLYQAKSLMAFKRQNCVVLNVQGCVMESMSEHNQNLGIVGAMNELNKLEQNADKVNAIWPTLEAGLGQSGSTGDGVDEKPFQTTLSGVPVNLHKLNPLQMLLLASNQLSVARPVSVNDGSRVVPVTSGCCDKLGCIIDRLVPPVGAPPDKHKGKTFGSFTSDISGSRNVRKVDESAVRRNQSMFLMEYLARVFALVHRGLRLPRSVNAGCGMFVWSCTRNFILHLTTNLRKATYGPNDIMERNINGALETVLFGKWVRSVLQTALHRRLMQTTRGDSDNHHTRLRHVLPDAIATFMLVPPTTAVMLSAMQLYLTLAVLDVGVMLVSCMVLYYNKLPRSCPLDVLALVVRGGYEDLSPVELQCYHDFAGILHANVSTALVPAHRLAPGVVVTDAANVLAKSTFDGALNWYHVPSIASAHICDAYFHATAHRPEPGSTTSHLLARAFAATQAIGSIDLRARVFWANAGPGTRIPIPGNKPNDRNHQQFVALNECPCFYAEVRKKLTSKPDRPANFGLLVNFLRTCDCAREVSRADLVLAMLEPWAQAMDVCLEPLRSTFAASEHWTRPIVHNDKLEASMFEWAVDLYYDTPYQYTPRVGLAIDVLWFILSQAMYASEWNSTPTEHTAVVHTRNMSNAAQVLLYLYMHTSVPKAAIPACGRSGVVLSEPSQRPQDLHAAICIPYRPKLHVDSGEDGVGFLNAALREPQHMCLVETNSVGSLLVSKHVLLVDIEANDVGTQILASADICPFPPEAVAHMLPALPSLMRTFKRMLEQHQHLEQAAECSWVVATRLFGTGAGADTLGFLPVALTQHALDEDVPCVSYTNGFCFVLDIDSGIARLTPVDVEVTLPDCSDDAALHAHSTFKPLPLAPGCRELFFPAEDLGHAMAGGLVLRDGFVMYIAPAILSNDSAFAHADDSPVSFSFMPIVRFQCLLMLEMRGDAMRPYNETRAATLTVAVLNTHADGVFLKGGRYSVRYIADTEPTEREATVDYILASRCTLRDGRAVLYTFTPSQLDQLIANLLNPNCSCTNEHVRLSRRPLAALPSGDFALSCHYTLSHEPLRQTLAGDSGTHIRIAMRLAPSDDKDTAPTIVYADVPLFDELGCARLMIHDAESRPIFEHFLWC
jgi:hypothetical protein